MTKPDKKNIDRVSKSAAARRLRVNRQTVYDWIDLGVIAVDARGKVLREPFEALLKQRMGEPNG